MSKGLLEAFKTVIIPIHREGYPFIFLFAVLTVILGLLSSTLGYLCGFLALGCLYFFRDPDRVVPKKENTIVSPADGTVQKIEYNVPTPEGLMMLKDQKWTRVSIFLSIFNVHVNRIPIAGEIVALHYHKGKFIGAHEKESDDNEKQVCVVETTNGKRIIFAQIAGLIARRIVCDLEKGQKVNTGDKYGIIRFGSRCDIYLPKDIEPEVLVGQTMIGGETIIAKLSSSSGIIKKTEASKKEVGKVISSLKSKGTKRRKKHISKRK